MKNPVATLHMENGAKIVIELLYDAAPNTVSSFIHVALDGYMDHHAIERIVPGNWIDMSYSAFGHEECKYLIPNEFKLHPELIPLDSHPGVVAMGGYNKGREIAGCEFFFPLRECPEHKGVYPVFGRVLEGMEEIYRLEKVDTVPGKHPNGVEVNCPVEPQVIEKVTLELFGEEFPEPVRLTKAEMPLCWI